MTGDTRLTQFSHFISQIKHIVVEIALLKLQFPSNDRGPFFPGWPLPISLQCSVGRWRLLEPLMGYAERGIADPKQPAKKALESRRDV